MNREDAAREIDDLACCFSDNRIRNAMHMGAAALREKQQRQPDPDTGLVPCGCGGRPEVRWGSTMLDSTHVSVWCIDCMVGTYGFYEEENKAKAAWNRAMGWKGDAE